MNIIINNYKKICNMLKENLLNIVIGCTFIFIISIIIGMLYGTYNFNKTVENVVEFVQENEDYEEIGGITAVSGSGYLPGACRCLCPGAGCYLRPGRLGFPEHQRGPCRRCGLCQ